MANDMVLVDHQILVQEGRFELLGYEELKQQVNEIGRYLLSIEVTSDNIQENKRLVAQVRKMVDKLNRERIDLKKEYLKPYAHLESQVKELTNTVTQYEEVVRGQIREIEEHERKEKEAQIKEMFERRRVKYGSDMLYLFDDFIEPKHLNKSMSMNKVEDEMIAWFENRSQMLKALDEWCEIKGLDKTEVTNHFIMTQDYFGTMNHFNAVMDKKEKLEEALDESVKRTNIKTAAPQYTRFKVESKDKEKVIQLLEAAGINYEVL